MDFFKCYIVQAGDHLLDTVTFHFCEYLFKEKKEAELIYTDQT